eukprot:4356664-Pyramimonas_sp.AAC.1
MAEWRHRDRVLGRSKDELFDDQFLYMGTGETRGLLMVSPELQEHINSELHREASILKEKRKVREERALARGGGGGGGGGGAGASSKAELQKK